MSGLGGKKGLPDKLQNLHAYSTCPFVNFTNEENWNVVQTVYVLRILFFKERKATKKWKKNVKLNINSY